MPGAIGSFGAALALALGIPGAFAAPAAAQPAEPAAPLSPPVREQILEGLRGSFALPWPELLHKESGSEWSNLLTGFSGGVAFGYPLKLSPPAKSGAGAE